MRDAADEAVEVPQEDDVAVTDPITGEIEVMSAEEVPSDQPLSESYHDWRAKEL